MGKGKNQKKKVLKIKCEGTQYIDFHQLNEFQEDIKTITREDLDKLKESIISRGYIKPGFIWKYEKKLWILDMHQRLKALTELEKEGWYIPLIPVVEIFAKTVKEAKDAVLVFTAQHGKIDEQKLHLYIKKYQIKLQTLVIRNEPLKIDLQQNKETKGDDEISEEVNPITKLGDLWELGRHRVLCGDSTKQKDIGNLTDIDLIFTDPPYGKKVQSKNRKIGGGGPTHFGKIEGSKIVASKSYKIIKGDTSIETAKKHYELCKHIKNIILWGGNYFTEFLPPSSVWIIWNKKMTGNFSKAEMAWTSFKKGGIQIYDFLWNGLSREGNRIDELKNRIHATQKPVGLFVDIFNSLKDIQTIFDGFLGSGSTLIACEKTNRICYGMEIEPLYCDVTVKRYIDWCKKNKRPVEVKRNGKRFDISKFDIPAKQGVSRE